MRCAIYTRKSVDEGLDAAFTTLDNQRDYCAKYIASQAGEGWTELPAHYDDGGWTGGNLKRPALTQLRADIAAGLVDVVVVYKIDRLSRSLRDFANLVAEFEALKVTFVSVTQSFDTGTAMGRLTLNVLLSFAQFERELTGERLRDWFANARERGLWPRRRPFGYDKSEGRLVINPVEAEIIRQIYKLYPRFKSARIIANILNAAGNLNSSGRPWTKHAVVSALSNRLYCGRHPNPTMADKQTHEPIIDIKTWRATQRLTASRGRSRKEERSPPRDALLKGMIFGPRGHAMLHLPVKGRNGQEYRYYVLTDTHRYGRGTSPMGRFRAADLERQIIGLVERLMQVDDLRAKIAKRLPSGRQAAAEDRIEAELFGAVRRLVLRVDVGTENIVAGLVGGARIEMPLIGQIAETQRTRGWWRDRSIIDAVMSNRPDREIGADLGLSAQRIGQLRYVMKTAGILADQT